VLSKVARDTGDVVRLMAVFLRILWDSSPGRALLLAWGSAPIAFYAMYSKKQKYARELKNRAAAKEHGSHAEKKQEESASSQRKGPLPRGKNKPRKFLDQLLPLLRIIFPQLFSKTGVYMVIYTAILCSRVMISLKMAELTGSLGSQMGRRDFRTMFTQQARFGLLCYPAALSNSLMRYFEKKIALEFRSSLTAELLKEYMHERTFYQVNTKDVLSNVDQMLTADVDAFCRTLTHIYGHVLKPVLDIGFISYNLIQNIGIPMSASFWLYFLVVNTVLSALKPNFSRMVGVKQELEGNYRADHSRVCSYSEEIAFVDGQDREKKILEESYRALTEREDKTLRAHFWKDLLDTYVLKYGGMMLAYSLIIPSVFYNWTKMDSHSITQHYIQNTTLLTMLGNAIKDVLISYKEVAQLKGLTSRVYDLWDNVMKESLLERGYETKHASVDRSADENCLDLRNVNISTPDGSKVLIQDLNLRVQPGDHLIVAGPNGTGKSSLFRVMAELWKLSSSGGFMKLPDKDQMYFISQNAYMVPGTLADQITYPDRVPLDDPFLDHDEQKKIRDDLRGLLEMVDLQDLLDRYDFADTESWQSLLSGGEKQRLVIARLYYHKPKFGVLDECTSQISVEMEHRVFEQAKMLHITILSICHNPKLRKHHKKQLTLLGGGKWEISDIKEEEEDTQ